MVILCCNLHFVQIWPPGATCRVTKVFDGHFGPIDQTQGMPGYDKIGPERAKAWGQRNKIYIILTEKHAFIMLNFSIVLKKTDLSGLTGACVALHKISVFSMSSAFA